MLANPNCCHRPSLKPVRILDDLEGSEIAIGRCEACETYWSVAASQWAIAKGEAGPDATFVKLTAEEAIALVSDLN